MQAKKLNEGGEKMKKTYETYEISIITISDKDVITTSKVVGGGGGSDIVTPEDEF